MDYAFHKIFKLVSFVQTNLKHFALFAFLKMLSVCLRFCNYSQSPFYQRMIREFPNEFRADKSVLFCLMCAQCWIGIKIKVTSDATSVNFQTFLTTLNENV